jgi:hypothetical protein
MSAVPGEPGQGGWQWRQLRCFTQPPRGLRLDCAVRRQGDRLWLRYRLEDPAGLVLLPPISTAPQRRDGLWEHTCLECFLARPAAAAPYAELNASPSGDWALYRFSGYRQGLTPVGKAEDLELTIAPVAPGGVLELGASLAPAALLGDGPAAAEAPLELAITAVLELRDGALLYWALAHGGAEPDFHRRADFQLRV